MSATSQSSDGPGTLGALTRAVEEGAGFPALTRAAGRALGASIAVVDRSSAVLAIAAASPDEEDKLRARGAGISRRRLRVADQEVGELRIRWRNAVAAEASGDANAADEEAARDERLSLVATIIALELVRSRSSEWADEEAASAFVQAVLDRSISSSDEIRDKAEDLGLELGEGAGVILLRLDAAPSARDDWQARALTSGVRAAQSGARGSLVRMAPAGDREELTVIAPAASTAAIAKVAATLAGEVAEAVEGLTVRTGHSRHAERPDDLYRAGREALLALNVAEAEGSEILAFEDTGSYRLLLSTMSENPEELEWFYEDTVSPLVAYDRQYGTDLVATVEAFLDNDGNVGTTAEQMYTHRHTIRYRLGRVRDLCGYDIQSTDGRERLGFGIKVMRVLGISSRTAVGPS